MSRKKPPALPAWLVKGVKVDYHSVINREVTEPSCTVMEDPWIPAGADYWVTVISGVRGWVACDALTLAVGSGQPAGQVP